MFIYVEHGDNQQFLANTNCSVLLLLQYVRHEVGVPKTDIIDLCDAMGTMQMFFLKKTLGDYANKFLTARDTYYVCRVEYGLAGTVLQNVYRAFVPLLKNPDPKLIDALHTQCDLLRRGQIKMLRRQEAKKRARTESSMNFQSKSSGRSDGGGTTRSGPPVKTKANLTRSRDKGRQQNKVTN
ncbi:uncharacterized protein CXorf65 homolog [Lagenorhynchus albirostris]|uniref:uncharacterized protein CXorf65 homolog n=1 Tax=Delphinus delphis TaxID=9728 RepID=UPI0028C489D5|nr:uncharacterized protein CXorf65 homolog [Delphinus delphis]XP_059993316.1 uncharacterized protein CXorf65 homolog [Lagenorhynchus albirostris]